MKTITFIRYLLFFIRPPFKYPAVYPDHGLPVGNYVIVFITSGTNGKPTESIETRCVTTRTEWPLGVAFFLIFFCLLFFFPFFSGPPFPPPLFLDICFSGGGGGHQKNYLLPKKGWWLSGIVPVWDRGDLKKGCGFKLQIHSSPHPSTPDTCPAFGSWPRLHPCINPIFEVKALLALLLLSWGANGPSGQVCCCASKIRKKGKNLFVLCFWIYFFWFWGTPFYR